tara:strand:- start:140 stop:241 length:102 start_codon:yes stop_codon:yes gene_type:complete
MQDLLAQILMGVKDMVVALIVTTILLIQNIASQ